SRRAREPRPAAWIELLPPNPREVRPPRSLALPSLYRDSAGRWGRLADRAGPAPFRDGALATVEGPVVDDSGGADGAQVVDLDRRLRGDVHAAARHHGRQRRAAADPERPERELHRLAVGGGRLHAQP